MTKALDVAKAVSKIELSNNQLKFNTPLNRQLTSTDSFTLIKGVNSFGHTSLEVGNGWGALVLGDRAGTSDNDWVVLAHDNPNALHFYGSTDGTLIDFAARAGDSAPAVGTNKLLAQLKGDGYFKTALEPRYVTGWYDVNSDDQTWSVSHGLSPGPIFGLIQLAVQGYTSIKSQLGWPNITYNTNDDTSIFCFDNTKWAVGIDDDLTNKGLPTAVDGTRSPYTSSGYAFRVILF